MTILWYSLVAVRRNHKTCLVIPRLSRPFSCVWLLHGAPAYCSDDLAIVCTLSYRELPMNIYVGNLAFSTTNHDLRQLFEPYGVVDEIRVIMDRETGRSKGFGFVEMPDGTAARTAITKLQGQQIEGRTLTVNEAKPREPRGEPSRSRWSAIGLGVRPCGLH